MKYSDIIRIKNLPSVFDLKGEIENNWNQFISNTQFEELLETVVLSFFKDPVIKQKSIWMTGTYGTGKSHASSVVKHLLCDPVKEIEEYLDESIVNNQLRYTIKNLRTAKRYFPVVLKGGEGVKDVNTFGMAIEKAVKLALRNAGITIHLQSDFESIVEYINTKSALNWENIIQGSKDLHHFVKTKQQLVDRLNSNDMEILGYVKDALFKDKIDLGNLSLPVDEWIMAVQVELRSQNIADGLLIIWDEFTDIVKANIPGLLVALQDIAERCMNPENDTYLYLIGHPSSFNNISSADQKRINDRFHVKKYQMNQVSTYAIMAKKLKVDDKAMFEELRSESISICETVALKVIEGNVQAKNDLLNLFPIHPYTAFLSTYCATNIGSEERSVFDFMLSNPNFKSFFDDEEKFNQKALMTADYLWDFYYEAFLDDPRRMSHITDRYIKNRDTVIERGKSHESVFKSILLLNALSNLAQNTGVIPSENNLKFMFYGAQLETPLNEVLQYFHDNRIVQRLPNGLFSIEGASFSSQEVEESIRLLKSEYSTAVKVFLFSEKAKERMEKNFDNLQRTNSIAHLSIDENRSLLSSKIVREFNNKSLYSIHIANFYALNEAEISSTKNYLEEQSALEENFNKIFILYKHPLENHFYEQFVETMANMTVASKHVMSDQVATYKGFATGIVEEWQKRIMQQHAFLFFRGEMIVQGVIYLSDIINNTIAPRIFSSGVEILQGIRKTPATFWKLAVTTSAVENALSYPTLDTTEQKLTGMAQPARMFLKDIDGGSYLVKQDLTYWDVSNQEKHPLVIIQRKLDDILKKASKNNVPFNIAERLKDLSAFPYGLYTNYPNMFLFAFAMRKYRGELYDGTLNKPLNDQQMVDLVVEIFKWWSGSGSKSSEVKLMVRFGSQEEKEMARLLVDVLDLKKLQAGKDLSDYTSVKNAILVNGYCQEKGAPFWVLKHVLSNIEGVNDAINKLARLLDDTTNNQNFINEAFDAIKTYKMDILQFLQTPGIFDNGYKNFLMGIDIAEVQENEIEEVKAYIVSKMPTETGWWDENIVREKVKDWRISKTNIKIPYIQTIPPINILDNGRNQPIDSVELPIYQKKNRIIKKIKALNNPDNLRTVLIDMIENDCFSDDILDKLEQLC